MEASIKILSDTHSNNSSRPKPVIQPNQDDGLVFTSEIVTRTFRSFKHFKAAGNDIFPMVQIHCCYAPDLVRGERKITCHPVHISTVKSVVAPQGKGVK